MKREDASGLLGLPNEVLQRIYVLSGNCHLLNASRSLRDRLDLLMLRPQLVEYFFAEPACYTFDVKRRNACDLRAFLQQPWIGPFIDDLPKESIRHWVESSGTIISLLVQGSWTQARGDLFMRALQYSRHRGTNTQYPVFQKSLLTALQEGCVPAVIVLGNFSQQDWIRWDQRPIDVEWKPSESYETMRRRLRQSTLVTAGLGSHQRASTERTTKHDFGDEHAKLAVHNRTDKPWTRFKQAGVCFGWQRPNMTTAHVLFCMKNVCRNPVLHEFVIRNTVDQWIMYHGIIPSELKTFILCKAHLTEIIAWALDPTNHSEGLGPATGVKLQLFYGCMLKRGVFGLEKSDLPWLCQEDVQEVARGEWTSFGISV